MNRLLLLVALLFITTSVAGYTVVSFAEEDCEHSKDKVQTDEQSDCSKTCGETTKETTTTSGCGGAVTGTSAGCGADCTDCIDKLCSDKMKAGFDAFPSWILSSGNEINFSKSLIDYKMINGKYPVDVNELIDSGLLVIWPANPLTGQPMKLVDKIEAKTEDIGKIAYVRESDDKAYFEIVITPEKKPSIYKFPCCKTVSAELNGIEGKAKNPDALKADSFERSMGGAFSAALSYDGFTNGKAAPTSIAYAINHNFFLIKENLKPDFISSDPKQSLYFEKGIATLDGELVKFGRSTMKIGGCCEKEEPQIESFCWVSTVQESDNEWFDDIDVYSRLKNKQYFYSTYEILNGGIEYDNGVLISKSEIVKS